MSGARKEYLRQYPSLADLVNHAVNDPTTLRRELRSSRKSDEDGWSGGSWDKAADAAIRGDLEGARRLSPAVLKAVNAMVANQPRLDPVYRLDEGRWIDVARYVKGEPECWGDMVASEPAPRKGVAIMVNTAAHAGIQAKALDRCGVAIGSAILGLQSMGYAVTLYAAEKIGGYGSKWDYLTICAPVNPGGSPLDISQMSVILRPWFLRRILFALEETYPDDVRECFGIGGGGYGQPRAIEDADARRLTGQQNVVVLNMDQDSRYPEEITGKILRQIKGA